ncbi:MAG TPA: S16 family serine protease [Methanoregulaceae archaeon]|nr:S16 family serine protease [Methanoregulaceae archaeon]
MKTSLPNILLIISLALNVLLAISLGILLVGYSPGATNQLNELRQKNSDLLEQIAGYNLTISQYLSQIDFYRNRFNGSSSANISPGSGILGTAGLQAPAVMSTVTYSRQGSIVFQHITQNGTMMDVNVEIKPGEGRVLVETRPLMGVVFQDAANTAVSVAENITGADLSANDVIFSIHAPGEVPQIDGPSAGALMTAVVTAAIENQTLNQSVTLTGTINPDGTVGAIGGVTDKAQAARDSGKLLLLLPEDNRILSFTTTGGRNFFGMATNRPVTQTTDAKEYIENQTGIQVRYVRNISDVLSVVLE